MPSTKPIGLFDSGVGGLTVARELMTQLPQESFVYFADTGRLPYGERSAEEIRQYTLEIAHFLAEKQVKMIIIACNTATALGLEAAQTYVSVPILGVIEPGAAAAVAATGVGKIGIVGTEATVRSQAYEKAIHAHDRTIEVISQGCPRITPLIEAGKKDTNELRQAAAEYLSAFADRGIDTLVYGCTHYPLVMDLFQEIVGDGVTPINPAETAVQEARKILEERNLLADTGASPLYEFFITGSPEQFTQLGSSILGIEIADVIQVPLNDLSRPDLD